MKSRIFLLLIISTLITELSSAACGPPECCAHPHRCGKGPELEKFPADESICLQKAAASVDGTVHFNPAGYPFSIRNESHEEMARVSWRDSICYVKYNQRYHN